MFNEIITSPTTETSSWIILARDFLDAYKAPEDIYRACVQTDQCDTSYALISITDDLSRTDYPSIRAILDQAGIVVRSSGYFDFDGDGTTETWINVRHRPGEKLDLWILVPYTQGIKALRIGTIETNRPDFAYYDEDKVPPIVTLNDDVAFAMERVPGTLEPYLHFVDLPKTFPDRFNPPVKAAIQDLFSGGDPDIVQDNLLSLEKSPGLLCRGTWTCDEYLYMLGLASELKGDQASALDAYLKLWRDYSKSPFTTMVRLKLEGTTLVLSPTPLPTPTQTPTLATPSINTPTATVSAPAGTVIPAGTPTLTTGGPYPTPVVSPTFSYPYPTPEYP